MNKRCSKCGQTKLLSDFNKEKRGSLGVHSVCKKCRAITKAIWLAKHPSRKKHYDRVHYHRNKEKILDNVAKWQNENPLKILEYGKKSRIRAESLDRRRANTAVERAVKAKKIESCPCIICKAPKAHAHHSDYNKPLDVMWLCPTHHKAWHRIFLVEEKQ